MLYRRESFSPRLKFEEDEARLPWLAKLLDFYAVLEEGLDIAVVEHESRQGKRLACRPGCSNCCESQSDVPVYPHELVGIYWFASEKLPVGEAEALAINLRAHEGKPPCPFLLESHCSIHPMRPAGCRHFNVFDQPCGTSEDPFFSRRDDVLTPRGDFTNRAFRKMLFFYGFKKDMDVPSMVADVIHNQVRNIHDIEWAKLASLIEDRLSRKRP